jgi:dTDP-4-dehydrorhamnose reductase
MAKRDGDPCVYPWRAMRLLITGAAGMLGQDVAAAASACGHDVLGVAHAELDVTDREAVAALFDRCRPDAVVNCAAWTDVDGAEAAEDRALAVNGPGAGNVARAAASVGAWTLHISSDYVFDGSKASGYVESDAVGPLSAYGRSKLAGEVAVAAAAPEQHTIVRSSWLFGPGGPCFPATIARLARERDELTVVDDQVGCPTFTGHLAAAVVELAAARVAGVLHVAGGGECSWYEFARAIVAATGAACKVLPGATADLARAAPRPACSILRSERSAPELPDWRDGLADYMSVRGRVVSR